MAETKSDGKQSTPPPLSLPKKNTRLGITHAGFAMTSLPHKRIEEPYWKRAGKQDDAAG